MPFRNVWQDRLSESGLPEILDLAGKLKSSGLFTDDELAPLWKELKRLVAMQVQGLVAEITLTPTPAPAPSGLPAGHPERIRAQLRKVADAVRVG